MTSKEMDEDRSGGASQVLLARRRKWGALVVVAGVALALTPAARDGGGADPKRPRPSSRPGNPECRETRGKTGRNVT